MSIVCALGALAAVTLSPLSARELRGTVQILAKGGKVVDRAAEPRHAVVSFHPAGGVQGLRASGQAYSMVTAKKEFSPRVLVVPVGATVAFPNQDPILHNVFSVSGNNAFDLGLYRQGPGKTAVFKHPGFVRVFCNVHQSMVGYVAVLDTPHFTQPAADGSFVLSIPDRAGKLEVWHEQTDPQSVDIAAGKLPPPALTVRPVVTRPRMPQHLNKLGKPYQRSGAGDYN